MWPNTEETKYWQAKYRAGDIPEAQLEECDPLIIALLEGGPPGPLFYKILAAILISCGVLTFWVCTIVI